VQRQVGWQHRTAQQRKPLAPEASTFAAKSSTDIPEHVTLFQGIRRVADESEKNSERIMLCPGVATKRNSRRRRQGEERQPPPIPAKRPSTRCLYVQRG